MAPIHHPSRTLVTEGPKITRNVQLQCAGDWGQANWHKIMSWITQDFVDRCGPRSRTCIWSIIDGMDAVNLIDDGHVQIAINTPARLFSGAISGTGPFDGRPLPNLRALATFGQDDRMFLGLDPSLGCKSFSDLRDKKPKLKIALGPDNGESFLGYCGHRYLEAHGVSVQTIKSWGGEVIVASKPEECLLPAADTKSGINAVLQEAIMTPWWADLIDGPRSFIPIPGEPQALESLKEKLPGMELASIPKGYWNSLDREIPTIEFRDFVLLCRDDLPDDIAFLITWIIVNKKAFLERQYQHLDPKKSPVEWPLDPRRMAQTSVPLHPAAERFYRENGYL